MQLPLLLVADEPKPEPLPRLSVVAGRALADEGARLAADGADAETGGEFSDAALAFFIAELKRANGSPIGVAEVRLNAEGVVPAVREQRAWGRVPQRAAKLGFARHVGYGPSPDPRSHSCPRSLWVWTGKP